MSKSAGLSSAVAEAKRKAQAEARAQARRRAVAGEDLDPERARLDVYFDFICPWCARFEISQAETLDEMRSAGLVDVYYHPLAYLDGASSGTQYSTRAASAAVLVYQEAPSHSWVSFSSSWRISQPRAPRG